MNRLNSQLWLGSCEDAANLDALKSAGITAVLNMTKEPDPPAVLANLAYLQLDQDDGVAMPVTQILLGLIWLDNMVNDLNGVVLIHCAAGISRTAAMAIAFLMTVGFSWDEGETLVRAARFYIQPHPLLKESVLRALQRWPYDGSMQP